VPSRHCDGNPGREGSRQRRRGDLIKACSVNARFSATSFPRATSTTVSIDPVPSAWRLQCPDARIAKRACEGPAPFECWGAGKASYNGAPLGRSPPLADFAQIATAPCHTDRAAPYCKLQHAR
jgi:hypothetical protein